MLRKLSLKQWISQVTIIAWINAKDESPHQIFTVYTRVNTIKNNSSRDHNVEPLIKHLMGYGPGDH